MTRPLLLGPPLGLFSESDGNCGQLTFPVEFGTTAVGRSGFGEHAGRVGHPSGDQGPQSGGSMLN